MKYLIGFTNKYYTLWYETLETRVVGEETYNIHKYTYLQNLSFDKEAAFDKAPEGATFDESLRGLSKSFERTIITVNPDTFHCGKYTGNKFINIDDYEYMMWFFNNCAKENQKQNILDIILPKGYEVIELNDKPYVISPEEAYWRNERLNANEVGRKLIANSKEFVIIPTRNLDYEGNLYIEEYDLEIHFNNFDVKDYQGYEYGLPLDNKGKAKRIKNKELKIIDFVVLNNDKYTGRNKINVVDWIFNK